MTPTTKAGPKPVKLMATAQFDNKQCAFQYAWIIKKPNQNTEYSISYTRAPMSMHCQVVRFLANICLWGGGKKKQTHINRKNANIVSNYKS